MSLQEIRKATSEDCIEAEQLARKDKWSLIVGPSVVTAAGGVSAGVAVAARSHFGLAESCAQLRGPDLSSRLRAAWFPGVVRGGVHLITAYLWTSEPPTSMRNRALLEALAQLLDALSGPWIVSADWQCSPDALTCAGVPAMLHGRIFAPSVPTCGSEIMDFLLVADALSHVVEGRPVAR